MNLGKCDRCDKTFEHPEKHNEYLICKLTAPREGNDMPADEQDVCPKCYKVFLRWWQDLPPIAQAKKPNILQRLCARVGVWWEE